MSQAWAFLPRKLLAGLIAVTILYFVGYERFLSPPPDPVAAFCSGAQVGVPVTKVLADARAAELSTTLADDLLQVYRHDPDHPGRCRMRLRDGFVADVRFAPASNIPGP